MGLGGLAPLGMGNAEKRRHFFVEEAAAGAVGLNPLAVEDELGDCFLAYVFQNLICGAGGLLNIDLFVGNVVLGEEALGLAAVATPGG